MAFGNARNTIIHKGELPEPTYSGSNRAYNGPFIFTGEFLLRGVIAASIGCPRRKVTRGLDSFRTYHGVPDPVLLTVCLYPFPRPAHISDSCPPLAAPLGGGVSPVNRLLRGQGLD